MTARDGQSDSRSFSLNGIASSTLQRTFTGPSGARASGKVAVTASADMTADTLTSLRWRAKASASASKPSKGTYIPVGSAQGRIEVSFSVAARTPVVIKVSGQATSTDGNACTEVDGTLKDPDGDVIAHFRSATGACGAGGSINAAAPAVLEPGAYNFQAELSITTDGDDDAGSASADVTAALSFADACTIEGTSGDDPHLDGTSGDDVICGLGGNDTIDGKGGDDLIVTQGGNDVIKGGPGEDTIRAGGGLNGVDGGPGDDESLRQAATRIEALSAQTGQRVSAVHQPREQPRVLLGVVLPLGELVDVVQHRVEHLEVRLHAGLPQLVRQVLQAVQHGGDRAVLVLQGRQHVVAEVDQDHDGFASASKAGLRSHPAKYSSLFCWHHPQMHPKSATNQNFGLWLAHNLSSALGLSSIAPSIFAP